MSTCEVLLLGRFEVRIEGRAVDVPATAQRLVALLALRGPTPRADAAPLLWPGGSDPRARANLRGTLHRWAVADAVVGECPAGLGLRPTARVDVHDYLRRAVALCEGCGEADVSPEWLDTGDLLPGWYDEWVLPEQERVRQVRLHALEAASRCCVRTGRWAAAVELALLAVRLDPLRDTAQRTLIEAHLAEGNVSESIRAYEGYRSLLMRELGLCPSRELAELMAGWSGGGRLGSAQTRSIMVNVENSRSA